MSIERFAGFDLDKVFEDAEAERARLLAEEERRKRHEALEGKLGRKKPEAPIAGKTAGQQAVIAYKDVEFEHPAYREPDASDKKLFYFDGSLERVKAAGFSRHAHPVEAFSLIIDGLEGKLAAGEKSVFDDMLSSSGEWFSVAGERKDDKFVVYFDPENIKWNGSVYVIEGGKVKCAEVREYDVAGKASQAWIDLREFSADFVNDFYGRTFDELPKEMREGGKRAQVLLPPEEVAWPVGRGYFGRFSVISYDCSSRASRGVRPRAPKTV